MRRRLPAGTTLRLCYFANSCGICNKEDVAQSLSIKIMPLKSGAQVIIACEKRPKPIGLSGASPIKGAFGSTNYPIDSHSC